MNHTVAAIRRSIRAALTTSRPLGYATLSGIIGAHVNTGRLVRTGDILDRIGAGDLPDGQKSWYGRHVAKAYRACHLGADTVRVWSQHRTTGRWIHVYVYDPADPALYTALHSYKATQPYAATSFAEVA
ncbi:hypothetical protein [Streptomyces sp. CBMA152]|uniref:hypothetical protein n=1 Tax=Streptomyces sp. CBMA152 TaxID=1896312 RepID=UPI0016600BAF|nr:hypothetical protein [Streptomyces sp. CBMA152]MBD0743572.1 hypothetical protein [Streptomyces sp. CBMA152]